MSVEKQTRTIAVLQHSRQDQWSIHYWLGAWYVKEPPLELQGKKSPKSAWIMASANPHSLKKGDVFFSWLFWGDFELWIWMCFSIHLTRNFISFDVSIRCFAVLSHWITRIWSTPWKASSARWHRHGARYDAKSEMIPTETLRFARRKALLVGRQRKLHKPLKRS